MYIYLSVYVCVRVCVIYKRSMQFCKQITLLADVVIMILITMTCCRYVPRFNTSSADVQVCQYWPATQQLRARHVRRECARGRLVPVSAAGVCTHATAV